MKRRIKRLLITPLLMLIGGGGKDDPLPMAALTPERTLTVVAMGDSLTAGNEDAPGLGGYPARLEQLLNEVHPGTQVVNLGRSGWTSAQLLNRQLPTAIQIKPDIAIVWIGSNNLWRYYRHYGKPASMDRQPACKLGFGQLGQRELGQRKLGQRKLGYD